MRTLTKQLVAWMLILVLVNGLLVSVRAEETTEEAVNQAPTPIRIVPLTAESLSAALEGYTEELYVPYTAEEYGNYDYREVKDIAYTGDLYVDDSGNIRTTGLWVYDISGEGLNIDGVKFYTFNTREWVSNSQKAKISRILNTGDDTLQMYVARQRYIYEVLFKNENESNIFLEVRKSCDSTDVTPVDDITIPENSELPEEPEPSEETTVEPSEETTVEPSTPETEEAWHCKDSKTQVEFIRLQNADSAVNNYYAHDLAYVVSSLIVDCINGSVNKYMGYCTSATTLNTYDILNLNINPKTLASLKGMADAFNYIITYDSSVDSHKVVYVNKPNGGSIIYYNGNKQAVRKEQSASYVIEGIGGASEGVVIGRPPIIMNIDTWVDIAGEEVVRLEKIRDNFSKFTDISPDHWGYKYLKTIYAYGMISGVKKNEVAPDRVMNRGMFVTMLYRLAGSPEIEVGSHFKDIDKNAYYAKPVYWALQKGITAGTSSTTFSPSMVLTREQAVTFLYRAHQIMGIGFGDDTGISTTIDDYVDKESVSGWALESMTLAIKRGVIKGMKQNGNPVISPKSSLTRVQAATMLYRILDFNKLSLWGDLS